MTTRAAPRIGPELRAAIALADDGSSAAEICRRVGDVAERLAMARPSYQQVRVIVRAQRLNAPPAAEAGVRRESQVSGWELLQDVLWRARPATDIEPWLYGERLPYRRSARNEPRK